MKHTLQKIKKIESRTLYINLFILIFFFVLYLSESGAFQYENLILDELEIKFHPTDFPVKVRNPIKKFKYQKIDQSFFDGVEKNLVGQLKNNGYFLSKIDSVKISHIRDTTSARVTFYITPGIQFLLGKIKINGVDSLEGLSLREMEEIATMYLNRPFTEVLQKKLFSEIVDICENNGFPLCRVRTRDFEIDSLSTDQKKITLYLEVDPGKLVRINDLKIPAKSQTGIDYLRRILRFRQNEIYDERRVKQYLQILNRQDFISSIGNPKVIMVDSLFFLELSFEESSSTTVDGIIGYVPPAVNNPVERGYFTGEFKVGLRNVLGSGRRLRVDWQKPDKLSEDFRVQYRESFLLGLPFHLGGELHRLIRDTTYIEWEYSGNLELPMNENLSGIFRFYTRQVFPDSLASLRNRFPKTKAVHTVVGFKWDSRDNIFNPTSGLLISMLIDYGKQRNLGPPYLLQEDSLASSNSLTRFTGDLALFLKLWGKQILAFDLHSVLIGYRDKYVRLPDMFWFGGASTIRGFREQQFVTDRVVWLNSEFRFLSGPRSRLFLFNDWGYYIKNERDRQGEILIGYGMGVRFPGPLGILQVDYGLARGLSFREGKIHFRLINEF
jgi:outer membrane protein insertion porin family